MQRSDHCDVFSYPRASIVAPAGCGKTQFIIDSLKKRPIRKLVLILTHTHAGVNVLRQRLARAEIDKTKIKIETIDGWVLRLVKTFPKRALVNEKDLRQLNYNKLEHQAIEIIKNKHLTQILEATYEHIFVDEYQDCTLTQHQLIDNLASTIHTCVLGDPLQSIFTFDKSNQIVSWKVVEESFPCVKKLTIPWRWNNKKCLEFGKWVLSIRHNLENNLPISLIDLPEEINVVTTLNLNEKINKIKQIKGPCLIIGDSANAKSRIMLSKRIYGTQIIEAVDLKHLKAFCQDFELNHDDCLKRFLTFFSEYVTQINAPHIIKRIGSLIRKRAKIPPNQIETACLNFKQCPTYEKLLIIIREYLKNCNTRVVAPMTVTVLIKSIELASVKQIHLHDAFLYYQNLYRKIGYDLGEKIIGSTLLLKGLEADCVVILEPEKLNANNLYVALTRGAKKCIIFTKNRHQIEYDVRCGISGGTKKASMF